jgi:uncharacterized protein (DUF1501 family)
MCAAACSSDNGNAAGDYTVSLTNRDNGCSIMNWTVGASSNATVTLTQSDASVTASVTGLGAVALELVVGGHVYTGKISGDTLDLNLFGTRSNSTGNCTYTYNSEIHAVLDGNVLTGQIDYHTATNNSPDCAAIKDCRSFQDFNGTRPPP